VDRDGDMPELYQSFVVPPALWKLISYDTTWERRTWRSLNHHIPKGKHFSKLEYKSQFEVKVPEKVSEDDYEIPTIEVYTYLMVGEFIIN